MATISINVMDKNTEIAEKFSAFVQEKSEVVISVTASNFSDYPVFTRCEVDVEGSPYTESATYGSNVGLSNPVTFEHGKIMNSGELSVSARAMFRTYGWLTATQTNGTKKINVLPYFSPKITNLNCYRCNANGTENPEGTRVCAKFSSEIAELNGLNDKTCTLYYKEITSGTWSNAGSKTIDYIVENGEFISNPVFDVEKTYDVKFVIEDFFEAVESFANISQAFTIIDFNVSGKGFAIGKVSEVPDALEFGMKTIFMGGIEYSILDDGTDLNELVAPNTYVLHPDYNYYHNPFPGSQCLLEIIGREGVGLFQRIKKLDEFYVECERMYLLYAECWENEWVDKNFETFYQMNDMISNFFYPIGSVYLETENSEPYRLYGTWEKITSGISGVYAWKRTS